MIKRSITKNNYSGAIKFELPIIRNYVNIFNNEMQNNKWSELIGGQSFF
jgi:hypothetical protein